MHVMVIRVMTMATYQTTSRRFYVFCKEETDDVLTGNADSVLGNVVNSEMFYNPS